MIKKVAVLGAGTMGHSIANNLASHGIPVSLYESFDNVRETVKDKIKAEIEIMVREGYFTEDKIQETLDNITLYKELGPAVEDVEFVIEALPEVLELKQNMFEELDKICSPNVILATNTSSLKLWDIMTKVSEERKSKVMVAHCYNPAHLIPIIELSYFGNMSEEDFGEVKELFERCEKAPVKVLKDVTGMVANRLLHAQAREAFYLIDQGIATAEDVDKALMFGPCFRNATTGMLECADMGGLDVWYAAEGNFFPDLADTKVPSETMKRLVDEGNLGIKTGKGFFDYPEDKKSKIAEDFNKRLITQLKAARNYVR